jgi:cytochrome b subunit of formate dehydrogenase
MIKNKRILMFTGSVLNFIGILKRLAYIAGLFCFMILCVTGFWSMLSGKTLGSYWLMIHVACAPIFAVSAAFLAVTYAGNSAFTPENWQQLTSSGFSAGGFASIVRKCCFWIMVILLLPLILSIVLCMFPIFGTDVQVLMAYVHSISAIIFAVVCIIHTSLVLSGSKD